MLCLTVEPDDGGVWIGDHIKVHVIERLHNGRLRLAVEAPQHLSIDRHRVRCSKAGRALPCEPGALEKTR
jgi:sRNA-binding carbon storage regulator CsrA